MIGSHTFTRPNYDTCNVCSGPMQHTIEFSAGEFVVRFCYLFLLQGWSERGVCPRPPLFRCYTSSRLIDRAMIFINTKHHNFPEFRAFRLHNYTAQHQYISSLAPTLHDTCINNPIAPIPPLLHRAMFHFVCLQSKLDIRTSTFTAPAQELAIGRSYSRERRRRRS